MKTGGCTACHKANSSKNEIFTTVKAFEILCKGYQVVKKFPAFVEPKSLLPWSQKPTHCVLSWTVWNLVHNLKPYLFLSKIA